MTALALSLNRLRASGEVSSRLITQQSVDFDKLIQSHALPVRGLPDEVNEWRKHNYRRYILPHRNRIKHARHLGVPLLLSALYVHLYRHDGRDLFFGLASIRVITNAGVAFAVDAFQNLTELELFRYHGVGTGSTAEAAGDTALVTELTTQYNPDNTRATGSLTEGASANIFRTIGTNAFDASAALREHGILSQAATGGGTLWDRSVFSDINVVSGDSLQTTYDLTLSAGG